MQTEDQKQEGKYEPVTQSLQLTGFCKCCGQEVVFKAISYIGGDELDEAATEHCNCAAAEKYTFRKRQRERAYKKIKTMFEEETEETEEIPEEITNILYASVDYLQDGKMEKIAIKISDTVKATLSITVKGKVRIDKTKTKKDVTEE